MVAMMGCCHYRQWLVSCCRVGGFILNPFMVQKYCRDAKHYQCPFRTDLSDLNTYSKQTSKIDAA
jgi:hypothetical protein